MKRSSGKRGKSTARKAAQVIGKSPGRFIRPEDVDTHNVPAAQKALQRLSKRGIIKRTAKGTYYIPANTLLGQSKPSGHVAAQKALAHKSRLTGPSAAHWLGATTQVPAREHLVVFASKRPTNVSGVKTTLRSRSTRQDLNKTEGALIEFLRDRGRWSELSTQATIRIVIDIIQGVRITRRGTKELATNLQKTVRIDRLVAVALSEPPRVRAILGALLDEVGSPSSKTKALRTSLNPMSRFEFGKFSELANARQWQAK